MKAAIVEAAGQIPRYGNFPDPVASKGQSRVWVTAAAMSHVVKSRANDTHYSSSGRFPFVVGVDGVGRLEDGTRVYFALPEAPYGSMAEQAVVPAAQCLPLPQDLDDVAAAAIANPGMSSWAAYTERARLKPGETVLVNGATGTAGRLAVQIARHLGAKKVIATGRNAQALQSLAASGADVTIPLVGSEAAIEERFKAQFTRRRCGCRLSLGQERRADPRRRRQGRKRRGADPLRPDRVCQRSEHHTAEPGVALVGD